MPSAHIVRETRFQRTARVQQLEGLFEVEPQPVSRMEWQVDLPLEQRDWNIGMIVGPSGAGKTTVAREIVGDRIVVGYDWPADKSIVDAFPADMGIKEITGLLSSVGFSSPPSWLRPFHVLSNGEQFRVTLARAMAECGPDGFAMDEFSSVIDRTVAQIGSAALAKAVRRRNSKFIAIGCHYDVIDWLQPDWIYQPHINHFEWRSLQRRPEITLTIRRVDKTAWKLFKQYHYLDSNIHSSARCYVAFLGDEPIAFTSAIIFPHPSGWAYRLHRSVCRPDYQGIGIGNALAEHIASALVSTGREVYTVTGNSAMVHHRARSPLWKMIRKPGRSSSGASRNMKSLTRKQSFTRITASFKYVGPEMLHEDAKKLI